MMTAIQTYRYSKAFYKLVKSFPGIEDPDILQAWLRDFLESSEQIAAVTGNTLDNDIVDYARQIIDTEATWEVIVSLINQYAPKQKVGGGLQEYVGNLTFTSSSPGLEVAALGWIVWIISKLKKYKEMMTGNLKRKDSYA